VIATGTGLLVLLAAWLTLGCSGSSASAGAAGETRFHVGPSPGSLEAADLNHDGHSDLVVASETGGTLSILLGDGRGGFGPAPGSPFLAGRSPNDVAIADFNHDGHPDLAVANHEDKQLTVLLGDGHGRFAPAPHSPFAVDVLPHTHGVSAGDLDGDGHVDLITDSWGNDRVVALLGDGGGGFRAGPFFTVGKHPYQRLRAGDVNGDGHVDMVTTNLDGDNVTVLLADGHGSFSSATGSPFPSGDSPFNLAIGDVNGDSRVDLAIVNAPSSTADRHGRDGLTILLGDGRGGFRMLGGSPFATGRIPNRVAIGDVNGDGVRDVAVSCPDSDQVDVFLMSRTAGPAASVIRVSGRPKGIALQDVSADGRADLLIANNGENTVTVILSR
jgi:hypothetical protein